MEKATFPSPSASGTNSSAFANSTSASATVSTAQNLLHPEIDELSAAADESLRALRILAFERATLARQYSELAYSTASETLAAIYKESSEPRSESLSQLLEKAQNDVKVAEAAFKKRDEAVGYLKGLKDAQPQGQWPQ